MANRLTEGRWLWPDHLHLLSERLVDLEQGRITRLIVTMPPQNGKSSLTSHWFPVWYLDRHADHRIIFVSYAAEYAAEWGRAVRNSIEEHAADLRVRLAGDSTAAERWSTTAGGGQVSVGIGGAVTGRRGNLLIFDDPYKGAEEANSESHRRRVDEFFNSTAYTRLTPDGKIIVILTRWHEADLVATLEREEQEGGEHWSRVDLPAIAEANDPLGRQPGEALWPERWPLESLERIKRKIGTYRWNALYCQRPTAPEGNYFKRSWFEIVEPDQVPTLVRKVRAWDLAATVEGENGNADPDWLAGPKMGVDARGTYYILDVRRERTTPDGVGQNIKQCAALDGRETSIRIEQEGAASGKIVKHHFQRMLDGYDCRFTTIARASKFVRSGPFNAACERGDVKLVRGPWNADFIEELAAFPNGAHDDQVDAAANAHASLIVTFTIDIDTDFAVGSAAATPQ